MNEPKYDQFGKITQFRKGEALKNAKETVRTLNSSVELQFTIRETDLEESIKHANSQLVEQVLKKASLYSSKAILLTKRTEFSKLYEEESWHHDHFWGDSEIFDKITTICDGLTNKSLFNKAFVVLPERVVTESEPFDDEEFWTRTEFEFSKSYNSPNGIDFRLSDPTLSIQVFEGNTIGDPKDLSVLNIWLPKLSNISLDTLLRIRDDEGDSFQRFQFALKKLICNNKIDTETSLKELFQNVDYEVRTFEAKLEAIKRSRAMSTYQAILGFSVMGLCFLVPSEIAKTITAILGVYQSKGFIGALIKEYNRAYDLKKSDFYIPWLLTKKDRK